MTTYCLGKRTCFLVSVLLPISLLLPGSDSFGWTAVNRIRSRHDISSTTKLQAIEDNNAPSEDWRQFRANLVTQDKEERNTDRDSGKSDPISSSSSSSTSSSTSWAYEAGSLIEKGSIILSRVEASLGCHDLRQPYFHKCAVLVLEHDDDSTRGIILNRASNLICTDGDILLLEEDEDDADDFGDDDLDIDVGNALRSALRSTKAVANPDNSWPMNFGGDIAGLFSDEPMIVALHSLNKTDLVQECSDQILPNLWVTSHSGARSLVAAGEATCDDFYSFYGFSLWEKGMLQREVDRGSWYIVSMDSGSVCDSLQELRQNNPLGAGLSCWEDWTARIQKTTEECVEESRDAFTDLMLKEWCQEMLCVADEDDDESDLMAFNMFEEIFEHNTVGPGSLVRASKDPEAYMLFDQLFHKSTVLLLKEKEELSLGLILNLPTTDTYLHTMPDGTEAAIPIRYGGNLGYYDDDDEDEATILEEGANPIIWLHCNEQLRDMKVGQSISTTDPSAAKSPIWTCSQIQALNAMDMGLAKPTDFLAVQGYVTWEKEMGVGGIAGQLASEQFMPVSMDSVNDIWSLLGSQTAVETFEDIETTFSTTNEAWKLGESSSEDVNPDTKPELPAPRCVHGTDITIPAFTDEALRKWIEIFLLDNRKYAPF